MKNFKLALIILAGALSIFVFSMFAFNGVQNKAISLAEQIETANSDIKVQEKRRVDLVYNLVDAIKSYNKHEYQTLKDVVDSRTSNGGDIGDVATMIYATAEEYPELRASENYKDLMQELTVTENMIAEHRSNYNKQVKEYNRYTKKFPNRQILNMLGYDDPGFKYLDYNAPQDAPQNLFGE